jgi:hypothetical protein
MSRSSRAESSLNPLMRMMGTSGLISRINWEASLPPITGMVMSSSTCLRISFLFRRRTWRRGLCRCDLRPVASQRGPLGTFTETPPNFIRFAILEREHALLQQCPGLPSMPFSGRHCARITRSARKRWRIVNRAIDRMATALLRLGSFSFGLQRFEATIRATIKANHRSAIAVN